MINRRRFGKIFGAAATVAALPTVKAEPLKLVTRPLTGPRSDWTKFVYRGGRHVLRIDGRYDHEHKGTRITMTLIPR